MEFTAQKGKVLAGRWTLTPGTRPPPPGARGPTSFCGHSLPPHHVSCPHTHPVGPWHPPLPPPEPPPPHSRAGDWPKAIQLVRAPPVGLKPRPVRPTIQALRLPYTRGQGGRDLPSPEGGARPAGQAGSRAGRSHPPGGTPRPGGRWEWGDTLLSPSRGQPLPEIRGLPRLPRDLSGACSQDALQRGRPGQGGPAHRVRGPVPLPGAWSPNFLPTHVSVPGGPSFIPHALTGPLQSPRTRPLRSEGSSSPPASPRPTPAPEGAAAASPGPGGRGLGELLHPARPPPGPGWEADGVSRGGGLGGVLGLQEDSSGVSAQAARQERGSGAPEPQPFPGLPRASQGFPALPRTSHGFPALPSARRHHARPPSAALGPRPGLGVCRARYGGPGPAWGARRRVRGLLPGAPAPALLPGRAWAAPLLSLRAGPPGLVVLNISQLRYRTVELLRTTEPSARSASAALWREEPRRPGPRPRAPTPGHAAGARPPDPAPPARPRPTSPREPSRPGGASPPPTAPRCPVVRPCGGGQRLGAF